MCSDKTNKTKPCDLNDFIKWSGAIRRKCEKLN